MIAKENTSGFIPELQIVEESIYEDAMAIVEQRKKEKMLSLLQMPLILSRAFRLLQ